MIHTNESCNVTTYTNNKDVIYHSLDAMAAFLDFKKYIFIFCFEEFHNVASLCMISPLHNDITDVNKTQIPYYDNSVNIYQSRLTSKMIVALPPNDCIFS
jgi:hypothetical protein